MLPKFTNFLHTLYSVKPGTYDALLIAVIFLLMIAPRTSSKPPPLKGLSHLSFSCLMTKSNRANETT